MMIFLSIYLVIGTLIALLFVWVHYSDEASDCSDPGYHIFIRLHIVHVVLVIVTLWLPIACQVLAAKARRR